MVMASSAQWTWVWGNSERWWRTGILACCSPWGREESDTTLGLNINKYSTLTQVIKDSLLHTSPLKIEILQKVVLGTWLWLGYEPMNVVVHWLRFCTPNARGPGSSPDQGTRSYMPQLKTLQSATKSLRVATKTQRSQKIKSYIRSLSC